MEKVRVSCKISHYFGKIMNLPEVGATQVSEEGIVEVPQEIAEQLVATASDWEYTDAQNKEEATDNTSEDSENTAGEQTDDIELDKSLRKALIKNFTGVDAEKELKTLAQASGVPKSVIVKAKGKSDLITMLINKLTTEEKTELLAQYNQN